MNADVSVSGINDIFMIRISGKLEKSDYERFTPEIEKAIHACGKIRVLVELDDFHGWTAGALWQDIKFDARHFNDIEKLAIVGQSKWEKGMSVFCEPFTTAEIRYFDESQLSEARRWIAA